MWRKITGQLSRRDPRLGRSLPSEYFPRNEIKPAEQNQLEAFVSIIILHGRKSNSFCKIQ